MKLSKFQKGIARKNGTLDIVKGEMINALVREKYSLHDELSLLRQRDEKPEEFKAYNAYAEECKKQVKGELEV